MHPNKKMVSLWCDFGVLIPRPVTIEQQCNAVVSTLGSPLRICDYLDVARRFCRRGMRNQSIYNKEACSQQLWTY